MANAINEAKTPATGTEVPIALSGLSAAAAEPPCDPLMVLLVTCCPVGEGWAPLPLAALPLAEPAAPPVTLAEAVVEETAAVAWVPT